MIKYFIETTNGKIYEATEFTYDNKIWFSFRPNMRLVAPDLSTLKFRTTEGVKVTKISANWSEENHTVIKFNQYI